MTEGRWLRDLPGQYSYLDAKGRRLASVYRYRGFWCVKVFVAADPSMAHEVKETAMTYRRAKVIARERYRIRTAQFLRRRDGE